MKSVYTRLGVGLLMAGAGFSSAAQTQRVCVSYDYLQQQMAHDPDMAIRRAQIESFTQDATAHPAARKGAAVVYNIPVVVHVLYNTGVQNISDAQILSQIDALNRDYQLQNADAAHVPAAFAAVQADCQIQFCMAQQDPSGNPTTGILRKSTYRAIFSVDDDDAKSNATGGDDAWPRDQYLNLWVVPALRSSVQSSVLAYAQFPGGKASTDGVVIGYKYFGTTGTVSAPFNKGRTTTHEVAHWLNLNHIWGDDGNGCNGSDNVEDTPNQGSQNYGCPSFPHISCGNGPSGDMFMNYMDYTDDACMYMFTNGQKTRMHAVLMPGGARELLSFSPGCTPPSGTVCGIPAGLGSTGITSSSATLSWTANRNASSYILEWKQEGAKTWNAVPVRNTTYTLTGLLAGLPYDFHVQSSCPDGTSPFSSIATFTTTMNGCTDTYEPNELRSEGRVIPVNRSISANIATMDDRDYFVFSNTPGESKIKVSLTNLPEDYDLKLYNSAGKLIGTSQNSGRVNEQIIYNTTEVGDYYVYVYGYTGAYSNTQCYSLQVETGPGNFREAANVSAAAKNDMALFPNPAMSEVYFDYYSAGTGTAKVSIVDASGRVVRSVDAQVKEGDNRPMISVTDLPTGFYFLRFVMAGEAVTAKLMIQR